MINYELYTMEETVRDFINGCYILINYFRKFFMKK